MKYLLLILLFSSCVKNENTRAIKQVAGSDQTIEQSKYKMTCEHIGHAIDRCENIEAVCYTSQYQASESIPNCHIKGK